jgi:4-nitrophenyl phosphatase
MTAALRTALAGVRGVIFDMDGVLWEGDRPLPGMADLFRFLRERGIRMILATNNASRTLAQYQEKIARMGAAVRGEEIITSSIATAEYLRKAARPGDRVFVIGEDGLVEAVRSAGLEVAAPDERQAQFVVCGMDRALTWEKLGTATINLHNGARFIGTNGDVTFPTERGITHGNGAILAALAAASGRKPVVIGKPQPAILNAAVRRLSLPKSQVIAIGDRLETDILGAKNAGLRSVLVLTGVTSRKDLRRSRIRPTWVVDGLPALQNAWLQAENRIRG